MAYDYSWHCHHRSLTENGQVPTVAKQLKDVRDAIMGGVRGCYLAWQDPLVMRQSLSRNKQRQLKKKHGVISDETKGFRDETETFKIYHKPPLTTL